MDVDVDIPYHKEAKEAYEGILRARIERKVYNIDTKETQTIKEAYEYSREKNDILFDPGIRLVGDKTTINNMTPIINMFITGGGALSHFKMLHSGALFAVMKHLSPEDIHALCSSSGTFRDRCRSIGIYGYMVQKFFPDSPRLSDDDAENFSLLLNSRLTVHDFQAANKTSFRNHPKEIGRIIRLVQKRIEELEKIGINGHILSPLSAVDAILSIQHDELFNAAGRDQNALSLIESTHHPETVNDLIEEGLGFVIPYLNIGIDPATYLDVLQNVSVEVRQPTDKWIQEFNGQVEDEITRYLEDGDEESSNILLQLLSLEMNSPYMFWNFNPQVDEFIEVIKSTWEEMLDYYISTLSEAELDERSANMNTVITLRNEGEAIWYNPDFNLLIEDSVVQDLIDNGLLDESNLYEDEGIVCDPTRFDIWLENLEL